jgi:hypothetical protein
VLRSIAGIAQAAHHFLEAQFLREDAESEVFRSIHAKIVLFVQTK